MSDTALAVVAVAALVLACTATIVAAVAASRTAALRASYRSFAPDGGDVFDVLERQRDELDAMRDELRTQAEANARSLAIVGRTVSRVATVRYDAFEDMGGQLSFSSALLDEDGNGVVLSCINGRDQARTYAKQVLGGVGQQNLSAEEDQAVRRALEGEGAVSGMADYTAPGPVMAASSARRARRSYARRSRDGRGQDPRP